jgi:hypothetical protein
MKALGLTPGKWFAAIVFGLLLAFIAVYAMAPHPVEPTVQKITPVPTPPPVVIGSSPPPPNIAKEFEGLGDSVFLIGVVGMVGIIIAAVLFFVNGEGIAVESIIGIIIGVVVLLIALYVMYATLDALATSMVWSP